MTVAFSLCGASRVVRKGKEMNEALKNILSENQDFESKIRDFISALNNAGYFQWNDGKQAVWDALYILEKPWKWQGEIEAWESLGRPDHYHPEHTANEMVSDSINDSIIAFFGTK